MTKFDLQTGAGDIQSAMKDLMAAWQCVTEDWNDEVSRKYCERHLEPIGPPAKLALDAIGHMAQQVRQMQRECDE